MRFEALVEDKSGSIMIDIVLRKILGKNGAEHCWTMHSFRGLGHIPRNLRRATNPRNRKILHNLPRLLRAYGKSLDNASSVIVVVDLDDRDCITAKQDLLSTLDTCHPCPRTLFRIAIEEMEAWLLGDRDAVTAAYPQADTQVLDTYEQDSICGTWEVLADAVHPGGAGDLKRKGYPEAGIAKCEWARKIAPHIVLRRNRSPSFRAFVDGVRRLATQ